ncbi:PAS domain S-box protein [Pedobacter sp. L105]|uniref:PAS domain S-box protein n=1 Tax=Pedobacter sp. L105 TaxID=1641871 RepID=UPI00131B1B84|nr:PAS domain S-box protein [Pedobacter sp. L105]
MTRGRFRVPLIYVVTGITWIFTGDKVVLWVTRNSELAGTLHTGKRIFFICLTGFLLFLLIDRERRKITYNEKQYRNLYDGNPSPIWFYDPQTFKFVSVNDAAILAYGYSRKEFLSMSVMDILPPEDVEKVKASYLRMKDNAYESGTWRHLKKDGTMIYVDVNSHKTQLDHKDLIMVVAHDTTEKFLHEQQLREINAELNVQKKQLAKNYAVLEDTLNSITDSYVTINRDWIITKANSNFYSVTGIKEDLVGKRALEIFPELESSNFYVLEKKAMDEKIPVKLDDFSRVFNKWLRLSAFPTEEGIAVYFTDITADKEKDISLKQALERYDLASNATGDVIYDIDLPSRKISFNHQISKLTQFSSDEIGDTLDWWIAVIHPEDFAHVKPFITLKIQAGEKSWFSEYRIKVAGGGYKYIYDQGYLLFNEAGQPARVIGAIKDIDVLKRNIEDLKRSGEILNRIHNPVIISNPEGKITWVNPAFTVVTGYLDAEVIGHSHVEMLYSKKNNWQVVERLQIAMSKNEAFGAELLKHTKLGKEYWVSLNLSPVFDAQGKLECYISVENDITERKERETLIGLQNQKLETVSWLNSHQIRKPVASILALTLLIKSSADDIEKAEMLDMLYRCSTELDEVIQEINSEASTDGDADVDPQ